MSRTTRKHARDVSAPEDMFESGYETSQTRETPAARGLDARSRLMSAFSIHYDGRYYRYNGYRYDRLVDAISYAELMQSRPQQEDLGPLTGDDLVASPRVSDRALMEALSISFAEGVYRYSGFHYDRLADAVNYAATLRGKQAPGRRK